MNKEKIDSICDKTLFILLLIFTASSIFSIAINQISYGLAVVVWAIKMINQKRFTVKPTPLDLPFLAYLFAETISLIFSINFPQAILFYKRMLLIPIVYLTANNIKSVKQLQQLITILIIFSTIYSIFGIFLHLIKGGGLEQRLMVFHIYMTEGGIFMIVSTIIIGLIFSGVGGRTRWFLIFAGIINLTSLLFTFTRSAWLGIISGVIIIGLFKSKKIILGLVLTVLILYFFLPVSLKERANSIFDPSSKFNKQRVFMWKAGIEIIKDYPLTGIGDIDIAEIYKKYKSKDPEAYEIPGHFHNNFIHLGVTLGLIGLSAIIWLFTKIVIMYVSMYKKIPENEKYIKGIVLSSLALFVGFNVSGLFEWNFGDAEIITLIWYTIGLSIASYYLFQTQSHRDTENTEKK